MGGESTITEVLEGYAQGGFASSFIVTDDCALECDECGTASEPDRFQMSSLRRLEGMSDPADMVAVVAITCPVCGARGTSILGFGPTATSAHPDGAWGHEVKEGAYVPTDEDNPPLIGPAGTVHCPLIEWAKFAAAHAGSGPAGWLTPGSLAHLHEGIALAGAQPGKDIAPGWGVTQTDPPRLTHSGSNGYNHAEIVVIPRLHAAVLVTCNAGDERAQAAAKELVDGLVGDLLSAERARR